MARIRTIKPEMRRDLTVASWPYVVRWTFVGLPGYMDDYGRGLDECRLIKAELYPLDDDMTVRKVDQHLNRIAIDGVLCRYQTDAGRFLHLINWGKHQRVSHPTDSRIPPCPQHESTGDIPEPLPNDSGETHEPLRPSRARAEQGREGKGTGKGSSGLGSQSTNGRSEAAPIDRLDLTRIATQLGADRAWAHRVAVQVMARAPADVRDPQRYVEAAIRERPQDYKPTPTPPGLGALCDHGRDRATCPFEGATA